MCLRTEDGKERKSGVKAMFVLGWLLFFLLLFFISVVCGGCANLLERTDGRDSPYVLERHSYYSTEAVWRDCVSAPWRMSAGFENTWYAAATVTWPFWAVDEVLEAAVDTVMYPADATWFHYFRQKRKDEKRR